MTADGHEVASVESFVDRWKSSGGAELANSQPFLIGLCDVLDVPHPEPTQPDEDANTYVFEKAVTFNNGDGTTSSGRVDLYRRGCFVLESKQGSERKAAEQAEALATVTKQKKRRAGTAARGTPAWEQAMVKARKQAEGYAKALPEWPPFLIVTDVGHCFDLYADFSGTGKLYQPFPDPKSFRIPLSRLADDDVRETLRSIWRDPLSLDPARRAAKVTRELAVRLAKLARSLEEQTDDSGAKRYKPQDVAQFLMRCLFTMFAEDVELIPKESFTALLESLRETPAGFTPKVEALWREMNTGCEFSVIIDAQLKQFNGGLFEEQTALPLNLDQLELLIEASKSQWRDVEPAIFGTLLERALDSHERHKLGAHYTPRAYVERLVVPTIIEPLRDEWETAYATVVQLEEDGKTKKAVSELRAFHQKLCNTIVLDPACGSGNFLYVSLELMKRLEGEVLKELRVRGEPANPTLTIDPHQFLGIEVNPRAAAITDLVLWIGYLQWHFRTRGNAPLNEPIIRKFHNIECRDAVLAWDAVEPVTDEAGNSVTRWDGRTTKPHPVTGEEVPDETARVKELRYVNPRKAEWPKADYIVGNPPFIGNKRMRFHLGDGYVDALRAAWNSFPESADFVMYWWDEGARIIAAGGAKRFGFITTNSITQTFNRRIVEARTTTGASQLVFAIDDHPWVDAAIGAAVRIAMTVCVPSSEGNKASLGKVRNESRSLDPEQLTCDFELDFTTPERINSDLTGGTDVTTAVPLSANALLSNQGVTPLGTGFRLEPDDLPVFGLSKDSLPSVVRPYLIGRDIVQRMDRKFIIDFYGLSIDDARSHYPELFQRILERVKPQRDQKKRDSYRVRWWTFAEPRSRLRPALNSIPRYIATCRTAKHRIFTFVCSDVLPDAKIVAIALSDALYLGILSSKIHCTWAIHTGGWLGVGNDSNYNHSDCFGKFPFPLERSSVFGAIRDLAEQLDVHRKRQQELHPGLTMTGMYNVLEKLRAGESLTKKEQKIHEQGLVSVLKQIHDDLDAAVFDAYGWPHDLTDEQILERLVALNRERAEEESRGIIRWLRPEFQNPDGATQTQIPLPAEKPAAGKTPAKTKKQPWPKPLPARITAVRAALAEQSSAMTAAEIARGFTRAKKDTVEELLDTLVTVGQARQTDDGKYVM